MDASADVFVNGAFSNSNQKGESIMEPVLTEADEQWEEGYPQHITPSESIGEMAEDQEQQEIPQYAICSGGLVLAPDLPEAEWQNIGRRFFKNLEWKQWAVGDWYAYGVAKYGKRRAYDLAQEATDWSKQTLYAYIAVARHFPLESCRRVQDLPFSHHRVVSLAGLEPEQEDYYLKTAKDKGESIDDLAQRIRNDKEEKSKPSAAEQPAEALTQPSAAEQPTDPKPKKATVVYSVHEQRAIANLRDYLRLRGHANDQKIGLLSRALVVIALNHLGFEFEIADNELFGTVKSIQSLNQIESEMEAASGTTTVSEVASQAL